MKKLIISVMAIATTWSVSSAAREISWNNSVDWVLASTVDSSTHQFVQWTNPIDGACTANRTTFSTEDDDVMALLLAAKLSDRKVSFYYEWTAEADIVPGHGSHCRLINVWMGSN